jgi:hypothetical protein
VGKGHNYKVSLSGDIRLGYIKNNWELSHLCTRLCLKSVEEVPSDFIGLGAFAASELDKVYSG